MFEAADRFDTGTGLKAGWTFTRIAEALGRAPSVASCEVARNATKTRGYKMVAADVAAE